jgi:hypothetical protein
MKKLRTLWQRDYMRRVWLNKLTATPDQPTEELFQAQMGNMGFFRSLGVCVVVLLCPSGYPGVVHLTKNYSRKYTYSILTDNLHKSIISSFMLTIYVLATVSPVRLVKDKLLLIMYLLLQTLFYTVNLIIPCMGISFLTILGRLIFQYDLNGTVSRD